MIEHLPQKIFLKDKNSVYMSCNENFARDLGINPDEIAGRTDYEFFPRDLAEKYREDDRKVLTSGQTEEIEEKHLLHGEEFWVSTVKTPVTDEQGNVIGVLGVFRDITERKKMEKEMAQ
ncbi:MAG: PAS domain-containing protein [Nitrospirota bacterium]